MNAEVKLRVVTPNPDFYFIIDYCTFVMFLCIHIYFVRFVKVSFLYSLCMCLRLLLCSDTLLVKALQCHLMFVNRTYFAIL